MSPRITYAKLSEARAHAEKIRRREEGKKTDRQTDKQRERES